MPTLAVVNFNIVCATLGGFTVLYGLVSYLLKEHYYLSESLISLVAGVIFSPAATNLIRPLEYALNNQEILNAVTLYFTRLVLDVQLVIAGVQQPPRYFRVEWKSLSLLLGPGMVGMWVCTSLFVWALVPNFGFVYALAVGACVTPTDPVLSNTIVKGRYANENIPKDLQYIIIAESGTNDGLGYPFLFLPLYLIKYVMEGGAGSGGNAGTAIGMWFYETLVYQIILGCVYGVVVGWIAKQLLHWAEERKYVDRESFFVFAIAMALFILGTVGLIGSDDVLASFIAGNTFNWDDWFRKETQDDSLQPTVDMLLNVAIFIWYGAVCPWYSFAHNSQIPIYRLIFLGILVLLLRRPPIVLAMHRKIHQIKEWRQALFAGYFGPIGVSAIFYLYVSLEYLQTSITVDGNEREDATRLGEVMTIVVWFLVICSIIAHGLSVPLVKLGFFLPRTISAAISQDAFGPAFAESSATAPNGEGFPRPIYRIGRSTQRSLSHTNSRAERDRGTPKGWLSRSPTAASSTGPSNPTTEHATNFPGPSPNQPEETRKEGWSDEQVQDIEKLNPSTQEHLGHSQPPDEATCPNSPTRSGTSNESTVTTSRTPSGLWTRSIKFPDEQV